MDNHTTQTTASIPNPKRPHSSSPLLRPFAPPVNAGTEVRAVVVGGGVDSGAVVAASLGALLAMTGGESEVWSDVGGGGETGEGEGSGGGVPGLGWRIWVN